jgi:hypothetical protein
MPIPKPNSGESQSDFLKRCMADDVMVNEYDQEQRVAVCRSSYSEYLAGEKISFDYDDTFSTQKGFDRAVSLIESGADVYIISARSEKDGMLPRANKAGILFSRVYATGSNEAKVQKVKDLNITVHYDNNQDVVNQLPNVGRLFT